jgi:hypothetical protein
LGVIDPGMSSQGTGYVRKSLLEPSLGTEHVRCLGLAWVNTRRPDISGKGYCNPITRSDKSGKGLSCCEDIVDRTCPVQELNMSDFAYWNLTTDLDKFGGLEEI